MFLELIIYVAFFCDLVYLIVLELTTDLHL